MKMIEKFLFMHHEPVSTNLPNKETVSAGLGPIGQYGIILLVLLVIGFVLWKVKKK